ncbi:MAG TPA: hypothetical protein VGI86_12175 [Acidimicrobiia bacterium]
MGHWAYDLRVEATPNDIDALAAAFLEEGHFSVAARSRLTDADASTVHAVFTVTLSRAPGDLVEPLPDALIEGIRHSVERFRNEHPNSNARIFNIGPARSDPAR